MKYVTPFLVALLPLEATFFVLSWNMTGDYTLALSFLFTSLFTPLGFLTGMVTLGITTVAAILCAKPLKATPSYMIYAGAVFGLGLAFAITALQALWVVRLPGL